MQRIYALQRLMHQSELQQQDQALILSSDKEGGNYIGDLHNRQDEEDLPVELAGALADIGVF